MKSLFTIFTLVFTVMFSSTSYAEWKEVGKSVVGHTFYVDFDRIRKHDGYSYYWVLIDYLTPTKYGHLSSKMYKQVDCNLFRSKYLSYVHHNQAMGRDTGESNSPENPQWEYPPPDSMFESILIEVCSR